MSAARTPEPAQDPSVVVSEICRQLVELLARDDLEPGVRANLQQALSAASLAANNLGLDYEPLYDLAL